MKKQLNHKRHFFRHLTCAVLAALLTLCLVGTCVTGTALMLLFDRGMHERAALDSRVTDAQMNRIIAGVTEICSEYSVSADAVLPLITRESIVLYNQDVISWWMLMAQGGGAADAPVWSAADLEAAVMEDELFRSSVSSARQKSVARNNVVPQILDVISDAVLPVRSLLVTFAMAKVTDRINLSGYMQVLHYIPLILLGVSALLMGAICLIFKGRPRRRVIWGSSPLMACAMVMFVMMGLVLLMRIPQQVGIMSEILAMQMETLMREVFIRMAVMMLISLLGGAAWMHLAYRRSARRIATEQKA